MSVVTRSWRLGTGLLVVAVLAGIACARDGNAQGAAERRPVVRDDTAAVSRMLAAVRGADPYLCELATRQVDTHGWWSRWGPMGDSPLDRDSSSAALVRWVQQEHNDPAVVPKLRAGLRDADGCVRRVSGAFLGRVDHPSATSALTEALGDADTDVRMIAALGLGLSEKEAATQPLMAALRDNSAAVRRAAAWALGSLEAKPAHDALINLLEKDSDPRVRQAAAWAIGRLYD
jgi:HEAT repeat protein